MIGKIAGTGAYVPNRVMDNNDIAMLVETNDEWIRERTGVAKRRIAVEETTTSMAVEAAKDALGDAQMQPEEIDLLLVATLSSDVILPSTACEVQRQIGAVNATCFDLNAACTGFLFAYNTAQAYIASGMCNNALIIGAESLSDIIDWTDRGTCILFGDGAGAAVIKSSEGTIFPAVTHSDGELGKALSMKNRMHNPTKSFTEQTPEELDYVHMDGQAVFKFAVRKVPEVITEVLEKAQLTTEDIDCFVLHQANSRIVSSVAKRLKTDVEKFPMDLQEYGNTSSASIPILLDELNKNGRLKRGEKIILAGFGGGLSWGAAIVEW